MSLNALFGWVIKKRIHQIDLFKKYPFDVQNEVFHKLIRSAENTKWGEAHDYSSISTYEAYKEKVPLQDYTTLKPWIDQLFEGHQNVLWNTEIKWFAKSSGTTASKSKLIPISRESLEDCHYKGGKDLLSIHYHNNPDSGLYKGKHLVVGGSAEHFQLGHDAYFGDLSAIIVKNLPWWAEIKRTPSRDIALMSNWEEKLEKMAQSTIHEDVVILVGVPSWTLMLLNRILAITGKKDIKEVWPNLELFMHGGVKFDPYRNEFDQIISGDMKYVDSYNASEGFFGIQDQPNSNDLLLMLDYGIFFEFIPMDKFKGVDSTEVIHLNDVQTGVNYALVISTNGGLWRYIVGDTIRFTSTLPFRFHITGRTTQFINVFGEELIVENTDQAIAIACKKTNSLIADYTVAPIFMTNESGGGHEWYLDFSVAPDDLNLFMQILDETLCTLNSDYEAKRKGNITLKTPSFLQLPHGTFNKWLKSKNKLGGQHKVPRLANNRAIIDEIKILLCDK